MATSIILGLIVGTVGFLPFLIALKLSKLAVAKGAGTNLAIMLLSIFVSLGFYIASILIFNDYDHEHILSFVISAVLCLILVALSFGVYVQIKR